jgi:hypothetical protein
MKRERALRWLPSVGRVVLSTTLPWGDFFYCLPSVSVIEQWPADTGTRTPQERLGKLDQRAWASIEALLRSAASPDSS